MPMKQSQSAGHTVARDGEKGRRIREDFDGLLAVKYERIFPGLTTFYVKGRTFGLAPLRP